MHLQPLIDRHLEQAAMAATGANRIQRVMQASAGISAYGMERFDKWIQNDLDAAGIHLSTVNHLLGVGEQP